MSCHDFQQKLALLVGDELEVNEAVTARRHIAKCPACREALQGLTDSRTIMRVFSETPTEISGESLWPRLRAQISPATLVQQRRGYPSWMPTATLAAACVALLIFVGSTPIIDGHSNPASFVDSSFGSHPAAAVDVSQYGDFRHMHRGGFDAESGMLSVGNKPDFRFPPPQQVYRGHNFDLIDEL
jgi:anti-sigma factor RsiW